MTPEEHFEPILTLLHEAALDEVHWLEAARLISEVTQTKSSFLIFSERRLLFRSRDLLRAEYHRRATPQGH